MSWTTPRTWVAAEMVTASLLNTHVRDNLNALRDYMLGAQDLGSDWKISSGRSFSLSDSDVAHGMTVLAATDVWGRIAENSGTAGGAEFAGFSDTDSIGVRLLGVIGTTTPTVAPIVIYGGKKNGTTLQALANSENMVDIQNAGTSKVAINGEGHVIFETSGMKISCERSAQFLGLYSHAGTSSLKIAPSGGVMIFTSGMTDSDAPRGVITMNEITAPGTATVGTNSGQLYMDDNGAGKTRLMVQFASGAAQQIAIQP